MSTRQDKLIIKEKTSPSPSEASGEGKALPAGRQGVRAFLSLVLCSLALLFLTGCGETTRESATYYSPNWAPDGRIVAVKHVVKETKGVWGNYNTTYDKTMMTAMSSDGTNEADLFEILGYNDFLKVDIADFDHEVVCAPDGKKIGYVTTYGDIAVCNYDGSAKVTIEGVTSVSYFDWSPDSTKIAYSTGLHELHVVNVDGTNNVLITSEASGPVSWKYANSISYGYLYVINSDGTNHKSLVNGAYPQNYSSNEVVYEGADGIYKIKMDGTNNIKLFSDYDKATLKLSFDNTKIVGGDLSQQDIIGIWVINIDGSNAQRLR